MKKITFLLAFFLVHYYVTSQTYLNENFDTEIPATWTITDEGDATGDSWISGMQGAGNSLNGTNGAIADSDSNGNGVLMIETLTSPSFDASAAVGLYLDFIQFYNNIGADTAIVEVFDGTNWIEILNQTADAGSFASPDQQHIDITAYKNANMQVRFVYNDGDVWAWYWIIDNVRVYNSTCNNPDGLAAVVNATTVDLSWNPGGSETGWEVINQVAGGPSPTDTDAGTPTGTATMQIAGLTEGTNYEFYVRADCGTDGYSIWVGPFSYRVSGPGESCSNPLAVTTPLPYTTTDNTSNYLDDYSGSPGETCGSTFSYLNGDDVVYLYTPTEDTSIDITLSNLTDNYTGIFVYDECADIGTACLTGATNGFSMQDLLIDNFSVVGGETYYILISTWAAPQSVGYTMTITENTCIDPVATYTTVGDCEIAPQFFVEVDLTDLGSATTITLTDNQGSPSQTATAAGIHTFGPYPNATDIVITVANADDANCTLTSPTLTQEFCQDFVVDCAVGPATLDYCYDSGGANDPVIFTFTSTDGTPLNLTFNTGQVEQGWDELAVMDSDGTFIVDPASNFYGNGGDLTGLTYQSTGDTISFYINSDGSVSCQSSGFVPINVTVACATCINPVVAYAVVGDCVNGQQFFVEVDLTDLGSATTITLADNQGNPPQDVTAVGTYALGPYPNATDIVITVTNADDPNCTLISPALTQEFCQDFVVDCTVGPTTLNHCYDSGGANDPVIFTFTSSDGTPLNLTFNAGEIEEGWDELAVMDSDGTFIVDPADQFYGNGGDLTGLTYQSTGDTISFYISSDGVFSCQSGGFVPIDVTVACATCINPAATYAVVDDCDNGDQFLIEVNITSMGDATSLTISNNIDSNTISVPSTGVYQAGPFAFLQDVIITVNNDQDSNCVIGSPVINVLGCPPANDNCIDATVAAVNADGTCDIVTPGTILAANPSGIPASCFGDPDDDVWFQFTAMHENEQISLLNVSGTTTDLDHAVYSGDCGTLTELYCSTNLASAATQLTVGETYFIRVFSAGSNDETTTFNVCISESPGNVTVDQTTYTVEQLIQDVLINSPCAQVSNITFSTGTDFGEANGIGYFYGNGIGFPFENGIILTSGDASQANGPNNTFISSGTTSWPGDDYLTQLVIDEGVNTTTNNATYIEFDFVPLSDEISFEFLMASEEYNGGSFECGFSDAFAFLLTDPDGNTTNLAVIPNTTTPILVTTIHQANTSCSASNEEYFGGYIPDGLPPISFDGRTTVFTAQAPVTVGGNYHIKLVIADAGDSSWDSGVFLKAGSFDIGEVELGADITIEAGTAVCDGEAIILNTGAVNVYHTWYYGGFEIEGEHTNVLTVTEPGEYIVQVGTSVACLVQDDITIEFLPKPEINPEASDLFGCDNLGTGFAEFILSDNDSEILGTLNPADFTVSYFLTEQEAIDNVSPLVSPYTNISDPQTIWARVTDNATGCFETISFNLVTVDLPVANPSPDVSGCDFDDDGTPDYDLTVNEDVILGGQTDMTVTYFTSPENADSNTDVITTPEFYSTLLTTIYVRVEDNVTGCYSTTSFGLVSGEMPITTIITDEDAFEICSGATVPLLLEAVGVNYGPSEVSVVWYHDGGELVGETGLTLEVLSGGLYEAEVTFTATGCTATVGQGVTELESCVIPQGISPNGDGQNDTFDLGSFGVVRIEIFNRLGVLVYSRDNYTDQWHGQSDSGDELPVGTYFYTMVYHNGASTKSAWVYLNR